MLTYIAPEVYNKALELRAKADKLRAVLLERDGAMADKLALRRRIGQLEDERRTLLLVEYASGNIS